MENAENLYDGSKSISSSFKKLYQEFMNIFGVDSDAELVQSLTEKNIPAKQVCAKILKKGNFIIKNKISIKRCWRLVMQNM
jgi:hypothetical protein